MTRISHDQLEGLRLLMHAYAKDPSELVGATEIGRTTCSSLIRKKWATAVYEQPRRVRITLEGTREFTRRAQSAEDVSLAVTVAEKIDRLAEEFLANV